MISPSQLGARLYARLSGLHVCTVTNPGIFPINQPERLAHTPWNFLVISSVLPLTICGSATFIVHTNKSFNPQRRRQAKLSAQSCMDCSWVARPATPSALCPCSGLFSLEYISLYCFPHFLSSVEPHLSTIKPGTTPSQTSKKVQIDSFDSLGSYFYQCGGLTWSKCAK